MKIKGFLAIAALFFASACGDVDPTGRRDVLLGALEQPVIAEVGFGVKYGGSGKHLPCTTTYGATCYYPNGAQRRVFLDSSTMNGSQYLAMAQYLDDVVANLQSGVVVYSPVFGFGSFDFDIEITADPGDANVFVANGAVSGSTSDIRTKANSVCTEQGAVLTESPVALNGTHRQCDTWNVTLDVPELLGWLPTSRADDAARHAIASQLLIAEGIGYDTDATLAWNGTDIEDQYDLIFAVDTNFACRRAYYSPVGSTICREASCAGWVDACY